jgi:hypothetical protein
VQAIAEIATIALIIKKRIFMKFTPQLALGFDSTTTPTLPTPS